MTKKIFLALAALLALSLSFSSCNKDNTGGHPKGKTETRLKVEPKDITVLVGKTATITVAVDPADTKYTFETANADIATVNDSGVVTGVKAGKTVITVKAGDAKKTVNVKVLDLATIGNTGIGDKAKNVPHFIYFPAKIADFNKQSVEVIKAIMTDAGWKWDQEYYDHKSEKGPQNKDVSCRFLSPLVKNAKNEDIPQYLLFAITYIHTPSAGNPFIQIVLANIFKADPLAEGEGRTASEKPDGVVHLFKTLYGFDTDTKYGKLGKTDHNLWQGSNKKAINGTTLECYLVSTKLKKEDLPKQYQQYAGWYDVAVQITFAQGNDKQASEVLGRTDARLVKPLLPNTGLRVINN